MKTAVLSNGYELATLTDDEPAPEYKLFGPGAVLQGNGWLKDYLPYQLYRVVHRLDGRLMSRLRALNVNTSQWRVLAVLRCHGVLSLTGIKDETLMEQPTVSRVVAQLERDGMVRRCLSPDDSRITQVALTANGVAAFDEIAPAAQHHSYDAFAGIDEQELGMFRALLARIERNLDRSG